MGYTGSVKIPSTKDIGDMINDILGDEQIVSDPESDEAKQKRLEKNRKERERRAEQKKLLKDVKDSLDKLRKEVEELKKPKARKPKMTQEQKDSKEVERIKDKLAKQKERQEKAEQRAVDKLVNDARKRTTPEAVERRRRREIDPKARIADMVEREEIADQSKVLSGIAKEEKRNISQNEKIADMVEREEEAYRNKVLSNVARDKKMQERVVPFPITQEHAGLPKEYTKQLTRKEEGRKKPVGENVKGFVEDTLQKSTETKTAKAKRYMKMIGHQAKVDIGLTTEDVVEEGIFGKTWDFVGKKIKDRKPKAAATKGAPLQRLSEFHKLKKRIGNVEKRQMWISKLFGTGMNMAGMASSLGSYQGTLSSLVGLSGKIPYIGIIIAAATVAAKAYVAQYRPGGVRDVRKLYRSQDESMIGIPNENMIAAGETLFISNPAYLQGMPKSNSNTENLRDGISRYNLRHMGDYP